VQGLGQVSQPVVWFHYWPLAGDPTSGFCFVLPPHGVAQAEVVRSENNDDCVRQQRRNRSEYRVSWS
jgi:hypothetical protein